MKTIPQILRLLCQSLPASALMAEDANGDIPIFAAIEAGNFNTCKFILGQGNPEQHVKKTKVMHVPLSTVFLHA